MPDNSICLEVGESKTVDWKSSWRVQKSSDDFQRVVNLIHDTKVEFQESQNKLSFPETFNNEYQTSKQERSKQERKSMKLRPLEEVISQCIFAAVVWEK